MVSRKMFYYFKSIVLIVLMDYFILHFLKDAYLLETAWSGEENVGLEPFQAEWLWHYLLFDDSQIKYSES